VDRLYSIGLTLRSGAAIADGMAPARFEQALDQLDGIIRDTQAAVFESLAARHRQEGEDQ
jgi:hypothetical protein